MAYSRPLVIISERIIWAFLVTCFILWPNTQIKQLMITSGSNKAMTFRAHGPLLTSWKLPVLNPARATVTERASLSEQTSQLRIASPWWVNMTSTLWNVTMSQALRSGEHNVWHHVPGWPYWITMRSYILYIPMGALLGGCATIYWLMCGTTSFNKSHSITIPGRRRRRLLKHSSQMLNKKKPGINVKMADFLLGLWYTSKDSTHVTYTYQISIQVGSIHVRDCSICEAGPLFPTHAQDQYLHEYSTWRIY